MFRLFALLLVVAGCDNTLAPNVFVAESQKGNSSNVVDGPAPTMGAPPVGSGLYMGGHDVVVLATAKSVKLTRTAMKISWTSITDGKASYINFDAYAVSADVDLVVSDYFGSAPVNKNVPVNLSVHESESRCPIILDPKNGIEVSASESTEDIFGWWFTKCTWSTTDYTVIGHGYRSSNAYAVNSMGYFAVTLPIMEASAPQAFLSVVVVPSAGQVAAPQMAKKIAGGNGEEGFQATSPQIMTVAAFEAALGDKHAAPSVPSGGPSKK